MKNRPFLICDGISFLLDLLTLITVTLCVVFSVVLLCGDKETRAARGNSSVMACGTDGADYDEVK